MLRFYFLVLFIYGFCQIVCSQVDDFKLINSVENFNLKRPHNIFKCDNDILITVRQNGFTKPKNKKRSFLSKKEMDSQETRIVKIHGVYFEILGTNSFYALGYEFQKKRDKHSLGLGTGSSFLLDLVPHIRYWTYTLSASTFYEYGESYGFRTGVHINNKVNPIMFTEKLSNVPSADKPPIFEFLPSMSLGFFKKFHDNRLHLVLKGHLFTAYGKSEVASGEKWFGPSVYGSWLWAGLMIKYNFKTTNK